MKYLIRMLCILVSITYGSPTFSFQVLRRTPKTNLLGKKPYRVKKPTQSYKPTMLDSLKVSVVQFLTNFKNRFSTKAPLSRARQLIATKQLPTAKAIPQAISTHLTKLF